MTLLTRDEEIRVQAAMCAANCDTDEYTIPELIELAQVFEIYIRTGNQPSEPEATEP